MSGVSTKEFWSWTLYAAVWFALGIAFSQIQDVML